MSESRSSHSSRQPKRIARATCSYSSRARMSRLARRLQLDRGWQSAELIIYQPGIDSQERKPRNLQATTRGLTGSKRGHHFCFLRHARKGSNNMSTAEPAAVREAGISTGSTGTATGSMPRCQPVHVAPPLCCYGRFPPISEGCHSISS